jgi:outer membrane protein assembly factor BamB
VRRHWKLIAGASLALVIAGIAAYGFYRQWQGRDVHGSPTVEFHPKEPKEIKEPPHVDWAMYGYDASRLRSPRVFRIRPPFRRAPAWVFRAGGLLEFPPVVAYRRVYIVNNPGSVFALRAVNGRIAWRHRTLRCAASSPAVANGLLFVTLLNRPPCAFRRGIDGRVIAYDARTGRRVWRLRIGPSESSPLVVGHTVYVGDWNDHVYAITARTGRIRWRASTKGKVKGGLAYSAGRVFVGSYDSHVYAFDARTGRRLWRAGAQTRIGPTGTFYSTPAVAYGRVYIGSTDGKVYAFGARSGKLRWSHSTGGYVYASPAVWRRRIIVGSFDKHVYALDAATGDVRWRFETHASISGSAVVINGLAYVSTLKGTTFALSARNGGLVWTYPDGQYGAAVADRTHLYVVGYSKLHALIEPRARRLRRVRRAGRQHAARVGRR